MNWADKRMSASARPFDERRCALFAFVLAEVSNSHQRDLQSVIGVCFLVAAGLDQRLVAIHHSGSGDIAQLLYQRRSNLGPVLVLSAL